MQQTDREKSAVLAEWHRRHSAGESVESINNDLQVLVPHQNNTWITMEGASTAPSLSHTGLRWNPKTKWVVRRVEVPEPCRARLHLICGNCGCNDEWTWEYHPDTDPFLEEEDVYLWCGNCGTLHSLNDSAKVREE